MHVFYNITLPEHSSFHAVLLLRTIYKQVGTSKIPLLQFTKIAPAVQVLYFSYFCRRQVFPLSHYYTS